MKKLTKLLIRNHLEDLDFEDFDSDLESVVSKLQNILERARQEYPGCKIIMQPGGYDPPEYFSVYAIGEETDEQYNDRMKKMKQLEKKNKKSKEEEERKTYERLKKKFEKS